MTENQASRILYEIERQDLMKAQGETIDEIHANLAKARQIIRDMADGKPVEK